jgi:hypothetical protein
MAELQFWIRGDLVAEQRRRLEQLGARAVPVAAAGGRRADGTLVGAAWTRIETGPGEPDAERTRIAAAIGAEPDQITGPYAVH